MRNHRKMLTHPINLPDTAQQRTKPEITARHERTNTEHLGSLHRLPIQNLSTNHV